MAIHTDNGHIVNAVAHYGGVRLVIECSEGVCEPTEFAMNDREWLSLVVQGFKALNMVSE